MNKITTKTKKGRKNLRMSKAAIGTILFDCIAAGRDGSVSAEAFMATMLSLHDYIEDAENVAGEDIDAGLWMSFKARVDKSAERSAAARLRWERIRAQRAAVVATDATAPAAPDDKPVETPAITHTEAADALTPQVAETEVVPEQEIPESMKRLKVFPPFRPDNVTDEMRRYGVISVEEEGYIRFEKEGYTGEELKKRVEQYVHAIFLSRL